MYFHTESGQQVLDLGNDFVLTYDHNIVVAQMKKAAPKKVRHATYVKLRGLGLYGKVHTCCRVCWFIMFGKTVR
jgi:hypothetical protein